MDKVLGRVAGLLDRFGDVVHQVGDIVQGFAEVVGHLAAGPSPERPMLAFLEPGFGGVVDGDVVTVRYSFLWSVADRVSHGLVTLDGGDPVRIEPPSGSVVFADVPPGPHVLTGILIGPMGLPVEGSLARVEFSTRHSVSEASS